MSLCAFLVFNFGFLNLHSQSEEQKNSIIEQRLEQIASSLDEGEELDYTSLFEDLLYFFEHPLNLNNASVDELRELYLLSDVQINNLHRHISKYGPLRSLFELQAVPGFDLSAIRDVQPFVTVNAGSGLAGISLQTILKEGSNDLFLRYKRVLEKQSGFIPDPETGLAAFKGTPNYMYARYRFQFRKNLSIGFTAENDPGETLKGGPDFLSAHLMYAGNGLVRKVLVGDYQILLGQGLTFWNGLGFSKSPFVLNAKKNAIGLKPYTSVQEGNFLRGGAITLGVKNFEFTSFVSSRKLDANLVLTADTTLTDDEVVATSINVSGTHRTTSEIENKGAMGEFVYGGNFRYTTRALSIGMTGVRTEFDKSLQPTISLYEVNKFTGKTNSNIGLDYQTVVGNTNFFGEVSRSQNGGLATVNGLVAAIHPAVSFSLVQRWFQSEYQVLRANVFGENSTTANNESGIFVGLQALLRPKWTLSAYSDLVRYPWLRFRVDAPSNFMDHLLQLNYTPDRKHEFYLRFRRRHNAQNASDEDLRITYPVAFSQQNLRINGTYQVHPNVQMKTRVEWTKWSKEDVAERGFLIYQDVIFKRIGSPVSLTLRYAMFDTDGYNSRIYAFESDLLYVFSILPYSGQGSRFYAMLNMDVTRKIDLWLRYGAWVYANTQSISSGGNSEIYGFRKSDVHIQMRFRF